MKRIKIPGVINKASVHLLSPLQLFKLLDEADVEHENSDIVPLIKLYLTIWCVLRICFPVWVWGQSQPVIAEDRPGQAKSVGRRAVHVLHHLVLHLLQDQVQGLSWKYVLSIILNLGLTLFWICMKFIVLDHNIVLCCLDHFCHFYLGLTLLVTKLDKKSISRTVNTTLTFVSLIPTSSSPDSRVPSLAAGVLSNTYKLW